MHKQLGRLATAIALCGTLAAITITSQAISNYPALNLAIGNNKAYFSVVAQETQISNELGYSSSYSSPRGRFVAPEFFNLTLHGYHNNAEWKGVTFVDLKVGNQQFSGKPTYKVVGPERIRTLDSRDANYIEALTLKLPANIARQMAHSKTNISLTLGFSNKKLVLPAAKLGRFQQLINSAAAYAREETANPRISKNVAHGLPIKAVPHNHLKMLETTEVSISGNYAIQAIAATSYKGQKLPEPQVAFFLIAINEEPLWANVNAVTFSYRGKKLRLPAE